MWVSRRRSQIAQYRSAAACELGRDLGNGPAFGTKPDGLGKVAGLRRRGSLQPKHFGNVATIVWTDSAVPSLTRLRGLSPQGQRETGKARPATRAAKESYL